MDEPIAKPRLPRTKAQRRNREPPVSTIFSYAQPSFPRPRSKHPPLHSGSPTPAGKNAPYLIRPTLRLYTTTPPAPSPSTEFKTTLAPPALPNCRIKEDGIRPTASGLPFSSTGRRVLESRMTVANAVDYVRNCIGYADQTVILGMKTSETERIAKLSVIPATKSRIISSSGSFGP